MIKEIKEIKEKMKNRKLNIIIIVIFIFIIGLIIAKINFSKYDFSLDITTDKKDVNIGEEVILQIKADKNVVASNFEINYNNEKIELVGSNTDNLFVSEKDGKIACIYFDINKNGTDIFQIKFKAINTTGNAQFSIHNVKFRALGQDESYVDEQIRRNR